MVAICLVPSIVAAILFIVFLVWSTCWDSPSARRVLTYVFMLVTITIISLSLWILIYYEGIYSAGDNIPTEIGGKMPDLPFDKENKDEDYK